MYFPIKVVMPWNQSYSWFFPLTPVFSNAFSPALVEYVLHCLPTLDSELTKKTWTVSFYTFMIPSIWAVPGILKALRYFLTTPLLDGKSQEGRALVDSSLSLQQCLVQCLIYSTSQWIFVLWIKRKLYRHLVICRDTYKYQFYSVIW